jgi:hypothetical protein
VLNDGDAMLLFRTSAVFRLNTLNRSANLRGRGHSARERERDDHARSFHCEDSFFSAFVENSTELEHSDAKSAHETGQ